MKHKILLTSLLLASGLTLAAPLNRYVPETALAEFEMNGLRQIKPQINTLIDLESTLLDAGLQYDEASLVQNLLWGGLGLEANLSVHTVRNDVEVLAVTRVDKGSQRLVQKFLADASKGGKKPVKLREGRFVFFQQDDFYFGFQDGLAYASSHPQVLREFFKRLQNSKLPGLSSQQSFQSTMSEDGGNFKAFVNMKLLMSLVLKEVPKSDLDTLPQVINTLKSLQGVSMSAKFTKSGMEGSSIISFQNLSPELQGLLSYAKTDFNANHLITKDVQGYAVSAVNAQGWLDYLVGLVPELEAELPESFDRFKAQLGNEIVAIYPAPVAGKTLSTLSGANVLFGLEVADPVAAQAMLDELVQALEDAQSKPGADVEPAVDDGMTEEEMDAPEPELSDEEMLDQPVDPDPMMAGAPDKPEFQVQKLDGGVTCLDFSQGSDTATMGELAALQGMLGDSMKVCFKIHQNFLMIGLGADALNDLPTAEQALSPSRQQTLFGNRALTGFQWVGGDYYKNYASQLRLGGVMLGSFAKDSAEKEIMGFATSLVSGLANLADRIEESVSVSYFDKNRVISKSTTKIKW
ncbi:hypothetical protein [Deinococcus cellulosilyticus]|uniref:DUF3352 domain-containing protein n=1 Tax=Deinococcus cellulosilyticus (strain DSM 18568 / NBRC 106333 / KACC 11606 / 5516J-15) TaxID=1223518 RepID=A0A511N5E9_DEIC1|nr:hypothetical protein [Deinococcus cellulosilyticus]GEM48073.1 hypothetical protein DC3_37080 [Deinococcus cellulosilyticus NBRC 106333 = KACC 11606]